MTEKNKELSWDEYVRGEVNSYLNTFLPEAETGNVGIKYSHPIKEKLETGIVYDEDKIAGVEIRLVFKFMHDLPVVE